jgi:hypothetical protein
LHNQCSNIKPAHQAEEHHREAAQAGVKAEKILMNGVFKDSNWKNMLHF